MRSRISSEVFAKNDSFVVSNSFYFVFIIVYHSLKREILPLGLVDQIREVFILVEPPAEKNWNVPEIYASDEVMEVSNWERPKR